MKKVITIMFLVLFSKMGSACTSFLMEIRKDHFVGKNYDWNVENGRVIINNSDVRKKAFKVKNPVSWVSKYGSVTFNQYGQEFPNGGMNEKGLVIEALWLDETTYPLSSADIPQIDNMQWIQFQLDVSATVEDVINNDKTVQIRPITATAVHYFIADKNGKSLIIEAVGGIKHRYVPDSINPSVLTNDPYDKSIRLIQKCKAFGGELDIPKGQGSIARFIRTGVHIRTEDIYRNSDPIAIVFKILQDAKITMLTKWNIVYDLNKTKIYFRSSSSKNIKEIAIDQLHFNCNGSNKYVNVKLNKNGNISTLFKPYSYEENYKLIKESIEKTDFLKYSSKKLVKSISEYKETIRCNSK